jgi:hypothetical protein
LIEPLASLEFTTSVGAGVSRVETIVGHKRAGDNGSNPAKGAGTDQWQIENSSRHPRDRRQGPLIRSSRVPP